MAARVLASEPYEEGEWCNGGQVALAHVSPRSWYFHNSWAHQLRDNYDCAWVSALAPRNAAPLRRLLQSRGKAAGHGPSPNDETIDDETIER
jgi:hypothetical protein